MAVTVKQVIYLGTFADADTDEATPAVENNAIYQQTFGSAGAPIINNLEDITFDDVDNNGTIETDNSGTTDTTDGLGGPSVLDSLAVVNATVTYADGSTATFGNVVMFQTANGELFLANSNFGGTDLRDPDGEDLRSITVNSVTSTTYDGLFQNAFQDFTCFMRGTFVQTPKGARVGEGVPNADLMVSQQHRILMRSPIVARITGQAEALIAAKALLPLAGVTLAPRVAAVTYVHILFDHHEVLLSNGAATESFWPGPQAMIMLGEEHCAAVQAVLTSKAARAIGPMARYELRGAKRRQSVARHLKNAKPIFTPHRQNWIVDQMCC